MSTQLEPSGCRPTRLCLAAWLCTLCRHLGISRPWGGLPSQDSILVLLTIEQILLEKAGEVAVGRQDSQHHPCRRPSIRPQGLQARFSPRLSGHSHPTHTPDPPRGGGAHGPGPGGLSWTPAWILPLTALL